MIIIESQAVGPFFKNGFIVACARTREGVIVDPGDETASLIEFARRENVRVMHILLTHAHIDHVTGVALAKRTWNAPVHLHAHDQFLYDRVQEQAQMFALDLPEPLPPIDSYYSAGEVIAFGECEVRPHHTPGHCPGGVCLQVGEREQPGRDLFVGDTLFAGSIGRTDLPGGDYMTLLASIRSVLFGLGDDARVHPGHGPSTTIGHERRTNPFLQAL